MGGWRWTLLQQDDFLFLIFVGFWTLDLYTLLALALALALGSDFGDYHTLLVLVLVLALVMVLVLVLYVPDTLFKYNHSLSQSFNVSTPFYYFLSPPTCLPFPRQSFLLSHLAFAGSSTIDGHSFFRLGHDTNLNSLGIRCISCFGIMRHYSYTGVRLRATMAESLGHEEKRRKNWPYESYNA